MQHSSPQETQSSESELITPIFLKENSEPFWTNDAAFYVLSRSGLFLCRNHPFFKSCTPARKWPGELGLQEPFLQANFPKIPTELFERIVGFFGHIANLYAAEAAVLLAWDQDTESVGPIVPPQITAISSTSYGKTYPIGVRYEVPTDLPPNLMIIGDSHSHVFMPAYSSVTDQEDESFRPGLHIVVGRLDQEPPDIYTEAVVDGMRFELEMDQGVEGYEKRGSNPPQEWIDRVTVTSGNWNRGATPSGLKYGQ